MTIRDVAARAGVSVATVSRVFAKSEMVALSTRQRVLAAAQELRYTPHLAARSLASGRTGNLGLIVSDIAIALSPVVVKAVAHRARLDDRGLFVADSGDGMVDEMRTARAMAKRVDGLLLVSPIMADDDLRALSADVPLVVIDREFDGVPAVLMTSEVAAVHAVEHLYARGHRDLVYLSGPDSWSNNGRRRAFEDTCARLGVPGRVLGPFATVFSGGMQAADLVLAGPSTGVLAYNDDVAVGVLSRLADRGVPVPGHVSVIGFDDTALASLVTPQLTTVRLRAAEAAVVAVSRLLSLMRDDDVAFCSPVELPCELVVRGSTGLAPTLRR